MVARAANSCAPTVNSNPLALVQREKPQNCTKYDFRNKGPKGSILPGGGLGGGARRGLSRNRTTMQEG